MGAGPQGHIRRAQDGGGCAGARAVLSRGIGVLKGRLLDRAGPARLQTACQLTATDGPPARPRHELCEAGVAGSPAAPPWGGGAMHNGVP